MIQAFSLYFIPILNFSDDFFDNDFKRLLKSSSSVSFLLFDNPKKREVNSSMFILLFNLCNTISGAQVSSTGSDT